MYWSPSFGSGGISHREGKSSYKRRELVRSEEYLFELRNKLVRLTHRIDDKESIATLEKIIESIPI